MREKVKVKLVSYSKPTELFEKVMKELEQLSGLSRPNRKSIMREYELLRD